MRDDKREMWSRRNMLTGTAMFALGGLAGCASGDAGNEERVVAEAPPLPWKWVELDPLETGRRAYNYYKKGGCGTGSYLGLLSMLKEKVGYPWTTLPDNLFSFGAAGFGGHGTLCGALGGSACIINHDHLRTGQGRYHRPDDRPALLVVRGAGVPHRPLRRPLADARPDQGQATKSPLCHTSVSSWTLAAEAEVTSQAEDRAVLQVVWRGGLHCGTRPQRVLCRAMDAACLEAFRADQALRRVPRSRHHAEHDTDGMNHQQGHMECLMCHDDHTA